MIVLVAMFYGKPGSGDEIEAQLKKMSPLVKQHEPGCAMYQACRSKDNPDHFLLYEHYIDDDALTAHRATPHFKEIVEGEILPLLDERERFFYDLAVS